MIGLRATLRVRMAPSDAHYGGEVVDGARVLALFGDLAAEILVRLDGDEGILRGYEQVDFAAPVFAGDFIEASAELVRMGSESRHISFVAKKTITNLRGDSAPSAATVLVEPLVVCSATGTCHVPKELQRHARELYMPALPAGPEPGTEPIITPVPSDPSEP